LLFVAGVATLGDMAALSSTKLQHATREIRDALQTQVLPHFADGSVCVVGAHLPLIAKPHGIWAQRRALKGQPQFRSSSLFTAVWPEEKLHAIRFPYFSFVLEGEIHIRLARWSEERCTAQTIALSPGQALFIPPGVFYPDARCSHWERGAMEKSFSRTLWLHLTPHGAYAHIGEIRAGKHEMHPTIYLRERGLWPVGREVERALQNGGNVESQLLIHVLFLRLERALSQSRAETRRIETHSGVIDQMPRIASPQRDVFEALCALLDDSPADKHSPATLAAQLGLSPARLNQIVRSESGFSTMELVLRRRLAYAHHLVVSSEQRIADIAREVGFEHEAHFSRAFKNIYGNAPSQHRRTVHLKKLSQS
jgi:AraC-like DNA-binding protein